MDIEIRSIGTVKNKVIKPQDARLNKIVSEIVIKKEYQQALDCIHGFSHIVVLYWMSRISMAKRLVLKIHPRDRRDLPLVGVFATRSQMRPNPIGLTTVKLLECHNNVLKVIGLDAINGTPVLDIKPYIPRHDSPSRVKTPSWVKKLRE